MFQMKGGWRNLKEFLSKVSPWTVPRTWNSSAASPEAFINLFFNKFIYCLNSYRLIVTANISWDLKRPINQRLHQRQTTSAVQVNEFRRKDTSRGWDKDEEKDVNTNSYTYMNIWNLKSPKRRMNGLETVKSLNLNKWSDDKVQSVAVFISWSQYVENNYNFIHLFKLQGLQF